jgi:hypothetical protein
VFEEVLSGGGGTGIALGREGRCADELMALATSSEVPMRRTTRKGFVFMAVNKLSPQKGAARNNCWLLETFL